MKAGLNKIGIIGGGLRGLVAAYEIDKAIRTEKLPFEYVLLEERSRVGGMIRTIEVDGIPIDGGAHNFDRRRADVLPFFAELGLLEEIQYSEARKPDRMNQNRFFTTEKATYHGLPLSPRDIWQVKELTWRDRWKIFLASFRQPPLAEQAAIMSAEDFIVQIFSEDTVNFIANPHYPENVYGALELIPVQQFDPVLLDFYTSRRAAQSLSDRKLREDGPFNEYTFKGGMHVFIGRLKSFTEKQITFNKRVEQVLFAANETIHLQLNNNESERVETLIATTPVSVTLSYLPKLQQELNMPVPRSSDMGTAVFRFSKNSVKRKPKGYGLVIPRRSSYHISKVTLLNRKWPSFSDLEDEYLFVEFGRKEEETLIRLSDDEIVAVLLHELQDILLIDHPHEFARVFRWANAVPHLSLETRRQLQADEYRFQHAYAENGIFIGGNGLHGYGMQQAILEGRDLARQALEFMKKRLAERREDEADSAAVILTDQT